MRTSALLAVGFTAQALAVPVQQESTNSALAIHEPAMDVGLKVVYQCLNLGGMPNFAGAVPGRDTTTLPCIVNGVEQILTARSEDAPVILTRDVSLMVRDPASVNPSSRVNPTSINSGVKAILECVTVGGTPDVSSLLKNVLKLDVTVPCILKGVDQILGTRSKEDFAVATRALSTVDPTSINTGFMAILKCVSVGGTPDVSTLLKNVLKLDTVVPCILDGLGQILGTRSEEDFALAARDLSTVDPTSINTGFMAILKCVAVGGTPDVSTLLKNILKLDTVVPCILNGVGQILGTQSEEEIEKRDCNI